MDKGVKNDNLADTYSEAYRHYCEVISIVRMFREEGSDKVKSYLLQVEKHRGSDCASRLRQEALQEIQAQKTKLARVPVKKISRKRT